MSAYNEVNTEFKDQQCLVDSLQEMGYNPKVSETPQKLEGYQGDRRTQEAEIILPRRQVGGASNDVGFKKQGDGSFVLLVSDYDQGGHFGIKKQQQLKKIYAEKLAMKQAKAKGLKFVKKETKQTDKGNVTRLVFVTTK